MHVLTAFFNKLPFTTVECDPYLWSFSDWKQSLLWTLLCKKIFNCVISLNFTLIWSQSISFQGFNILYFQNITFFPEHPRILAYYGTFVHLEKSSLNFSSSSIVIHVCLVLPRPSLFLRGLFLIISLEFFFLTSIIFRFSLIYGSFLHGQNNSQHAAWAPLRAFPLIVSAHPFCALKFIRHVIHRCAS